jgi:hypothetical protein
VQFRASPKPQTSSLYKCPKKILIMKRRRKGTDALEQKDLHIASHLERECARLLAAIRGGDDQVRLLGGLEGEKM